MNNIVIVKSVLWTIPAQVLAGATQQMSLPKFDFLNGKYIQGVSTYSVQNMPKDPTNKPLVNDALLKSSFITFSDGDKNQVWNKWMPDLITNGANTLGMGNQYATEFDDVRFDLVQSYIWVADLTLFAVTEEVYVLDVRYSDHPTGAKNPTA